MTEKKKTGNGLRKRVTYETPQVWCVAMEAEGIMAGSPMDFSGGITPGGNDITGSDTEDFFGGGITGATGPAGGTVGVQTEGFQN